MTPEQIAREFVEDDERLCDLEEQMSVCCALLALQRENAALKEALERFGQHEDGCQADWDDWYSEKCSCGLIAALTPTKEEA